jgi:pyruvate dehydrogenase E2 component (dihydrolipoamide acetyltransferase)
MPIRFRCAYCNQLMGIARRKAGTVVRCPKCAGEVIVPAMQEPQAANGPGRMNQFFEADDFGRELGEPEPVPEPIPNPLMPPPPYGHPPLLDTESPPQPNPEPRRESRPGPRADSMPVEMPESRSLTRPGVFMTVPMLMGAGAALLGLIAVTFLFGFFFARWTLH